MKNIGKIDKSIRLLAGLALIAAAVVLQVLTGRFWWLGIPGLLFAGTGTVSYCPLYVPMKINTGRNRSAE